MGTWDNVWADWRGRFSRCPRLYPGGIMLAVLRHHPKAETEIFIPVSDLLHHLGHQLMSSGALYFLFIDCWIFFPWFARFSSIAMVIDEVGFCKGIHNVIMGYVALWLSCYGTVHTSPFYSCAPVWCKYPDPAMLRIWLVKHPVYTVFRLSQLSDNLWICQWDQGAATLASRKCKLWDDLRQSKQLLLLSWVLEVVTLIFLLKTCWCVAVCFTEAFCCFPPGGTAG